MIRRKQWIDAIERLWDIRSVVWLSGVRRVGKTTLVKQLDNTDYFNCDLPSVRRRLTDPEFFLSSCDPKRRLVLDEVHHIEDPSLLLKIAADEYPDLKLVATGSSTLAAAKKFRDALTDRKRTLHLPPVPWRETVGVFGVNDLKQRLLCGGLPRILLSGEPQPDFFEDWLESFYARDIQELFNVRNRTGFLTLIQLLGLQSGGSLDVSALSKKCGISRPTTISYLDAMEIAHALYRIPPFFGGGHREIIKQPKAYLFDTGLIAHCKGWESIREDDAGLLWEHLVLDELRYEYPSRKIHYWRDKSGREVDFVIEHNPNKIDIYEAKLTPDAFDASNLEKFRQLYPRGDNFVICPYISNPYRARKRGMILEYVSKPNR